MRMVLAAALCLLPGVAAAQPTASVAPRVMHQVAPSLAHFTDEVLFGDVWKRPGLSPRDRSLVTIAALVAAGKTGQLSGHLGRALDNGVTPLEISGLLTHLAFYSGWPSAVSALDITEQVFRARGVDMNALRQPRPEFQPSAQLDHLQGDSAALQNAAPGLAQLTKDTVFGQLWQRLELGPRDRSLVTIAALTAAGDHDALAAHLRDGLVQGLTAEQMGEAFTHLAFYVGWSKATASAKLLSEKKPDRALSSPSGYGSPALRVVRAGTRPSIGPAETFTGRATVSGAFDAEGEVRLAGATVDFEAGARSNWHSHPQGQLLVVMRGAGLIQAEGDSVRRIRRGDAVWTPPGVRHWHGAAESKGMTHTAVSPVAEGQKVNWFEPVTDEQYRAAPASD